MTWIYIMAGVIAVSLIAMMIMVHFAMDYDPSWDDKQEGEDR